MNLKFQNSEGILNIDDNFILRISAYRRRVGIQKRYGKDGGVISGDQHVDPRSIKFSYQPVASGDTAYLSIINEIIGFFSLSLTPFFLIDTENQRRCEIALEEADDEPSADGLTYRIGKNSLDFKMLDGHWEDFSETIVASDTGGMESNDIITIDNDADIDCYPIITISPHGTNSNFTIKNLTTGALFTLGSSSFVPGTEFIVDSQNGTIYLSIASSLVESSIALADGSGFIKLIPGENQLQYTSIYGDIDIEIEYRRRYAF